VQGHDGSAHPPDSNIDSTNPADLPRPDFLQAVIRTAAEGICVCAESADFPYVVISVWNDRMVELTGYTIDEINRLGYYQTLFPDPELRQRVIERAERMRAGDDLRQEEWPIVHKDGSNRVLTISTSRVGTGAGRAVVAFMSDVTERKCAEEALRESEARLAMSQRLARLGSWEWDIRVGSVWWSEELYRLFGRDPATFRPALEAFLEQIHPDDAPLIRNLLERTLQDGAPYQYEARIVRPDGSVRWKRAEGVLEYDAAGNPLRLWGTAQDVTEQRHAADARRILEDQLREARRLESIGVLAGGVAHEFNNLLTAIIGHAELAQNELPAESPGHVHLTPIREAADRAADLCRKMLAYAGKGRIVLGAADFNEIVREAAGLVPTESALELDLASTTLGVRGDAEQLRQLVANLVANAVESGAKNVHVRTQQANLDERAASDLHRTPGLAAGQYAMLEIRDSGTGMAEQTLARAFEPFFSTKFAGRGLGLAVVLGVLRTHGGGLDLETTPGRGTTVRVYLPAAASPD
jgi:two-component system, cell cycle sensor histidine kinase and response regulator CckA